MQKVIILNAPPFSGKDFGAAFLKDYFLSCGLPAHHKEFKKQLFKATKAAYGIPEDVWEDLYTREKKELPSSYLVYNGEMISPRQAMINTSEKLMKPMFGLDVFGKAAAFDLSDGINVFSDGGFEEEIQPLIDKVGKDNILIIKIFREDCTFEGDSRNYVDIDGVPIREIVNLGDNSFLDGLVDVVEEWLDG